MTYASPEIRKRDNKVTKAYIKGSTLRKNESKQLISPLIEIHKLSNGAVG